MCRRRQRGFTLMEVIVAFAIVVLFLGALYESLDGGVRRSVQSAARVRAFLAAQSLLAQQRLRNGPWPPIDEGHLQDGSSWQIEATPVQTTNARQMNWRLYDVRVAVRAHPHDAHAVEIRSLEIAEIRP